MSKGAVENNLYVPFILISTILIVVAFAYIPTNTLNEMIQVSSLDGVIMKERVKNLVSFRDPLTLREYPLTLDKKSDFDFNLTASFVFSDNKQVAYSLSFEGKKSFYDEDLFKFSNHKIPFGEYNKMSFRKDLVCLKDNRCGRIKFEQILPKVYDVK